MPTTTAAPTPEQIAEAKRILKAAAKPEKTRTLYVLHIEGCRSEQRLKVFPVQQPATKKKCALYRFEEQLNVSDLDPKPLAAPARSYESRGWKPRWFTSMENLRAFAKSVEEFDAAKARIDADAAREEARKKEQAALDASLALPAKLAAIDALEVTP